MKITLYHNPNCSKSRKTLELIQQYGIEPRIVPYLDEPPSQATTLALARRLGVPVADLLRTGEEDFRGRRDTLDLGDDVAVADWLASHPRALQRPIVVDEDSDRAVIGRPPENVHELLRS